MTASSAKETRGDQVVRFIHEYCRVPEGGRGKVGKELRLLPFQERFIREVYDNPAGTSRAYLSMGRKNGKTALIACLVLAHVVGPERLHNSQIISGARSRDQASLVYKFASKMIQLNPELSRVARLTPSRKMITGLKSNVEFHAISAEAGTAHGLSPVLAILDEVGQVKGPTDDFVEAIETAQGGYDEALLIAISTQARSDGDLFSMWLDDAEITADPHTVSHLYAAKNPECDVLDQAAWEQANPALGVFRSRPELERFAISAARLPAKENSFRWLYLNQRVEATAPFVSKSVWAGCSGPVEEFGDAPVYAGLDLSRVNDLTAFVAMAPINGIWHVRPTFWLPGDTLGAKARADRVQYDVWHRQGFLEAPPGVSINYRFLASFLWEFCGAYNVRQIAFDRWGYEHLRPILAERGFGEEALDGDNALFVPFGQGWRSMSPALNVLESMLLERRLRHGGHPVLGMCASNATVVTDDADNRKLTKKRSHGRIDGMVALAMAASAAGTWEAQPELDVASMIV